MDRKGFLRTSMMIGGLLLLSPQETVPLTASKTSQQGQEYLFNPLELRRFKNPEEMKAYVGGLLQDSNHAKGRKGQKLSSPEALATLEHLLDRHLRQDEEQQPGITQLPEIYRLLYISNDSLPDKQLIGPVLGLAEHIFREYISRDLDQISAAGEGDISFMAFPLRDADDQRNGAAEQVIISSTKQYQFLGGNLYIALLHIIGEGSPSQAYVKNLDTGEELLVHFPPACFRTGQAYKHPETGQNDRTRGKVLMAISTLPKTWNTTYQESLNSQIDELAKKHLLIYVIKDRPLRRNQQTRYERRT
ncbi:MAG: hypothetical protein GXP63_05225 [DPANN group archaeon]|nr:hypothetical protein [DPANN group archaeon]